MKTFLVNRLYLILGVAMLMISCEKDEMRAILNPEARPEVVLSSPAIVLSKDEANNEVLNISWQKPDYGFQAGANYSILFDRKGGDFTNAVAVPTGSQLRKTFTAAELNPILLQLGLVAGSAADLDIKVQARLGESTVLVSPLATLQATPYLDKLDLSTPWGIAGSAAANGWDGPDMPFYQTDKENILVAYVTLATGDIKFRKDNKWDLNYGDDGANGTLEEGGANIAVTAGTYKITLDLNALTYTITKYSWGLVGSAAPNGWDGPDVPLTYDPTSDQWRAVVTLKEGELKIRQNQDWAINYGGANGTLELGGGNIAVTPGTYLVSVNFNKGTYTVEKIDVWGVAGSAAPNGWDGPDAKFRPDFANDGVWVLDRVTLKAGEIKFRQNDAWDLNYGDDGADGTLEAGGANIAVTAGTYGITLDFSKPGAPTYKITKK
ncbi:SusE domain-containing protein [Telluribacter sp. SYSU D00476]|uniref:SusE domain-containing protein n=1 Tax=Telluribacter sp. SYSU D00476 TaxID=2811430 RepID=UPI001FF68D5A|nr:SusE domain-containing protein [Telluribacter sp. SYSU D00476]